MPEVAIIKNATYCGDISSWQDIISKIGDKKRNISYLTKDHLFDFRLKRTPNIVIQPYSI